jgi:large-conductance mechanosensitive channel
MIYDNEKRMTFGDYIDKTFAVILIALVGFGVKSIGQMQDDLSKLSQSVAVIMSQQSNQKETLLEIKKEIKENRDRIIDLEKGK